VIAPGACSQIEYTVSPTSDTSASIEYAGTCAGFTVRGSGAGTLVGSTLTWHADGTIERAGAPACAFSFANSTATPEGTDAIRLTYAGTVCGVPVSGSEVVRRR
jgi:hypothetical protein